MKINEALNKVFELNEQIKHFLLEIGYSAELLEVDKGNPDETFYSDEFWLLADELSELSKQIEYLNEPIVKEGVVGYKKKRFFIDDMPVLKNSIIEVYVNNSWNKCIVYEVKKLQVIGDFSTEEVRNKKARVRGSRGISGLGEMGI